MIHGFKDKRTEKVFAGVCPKGFPEDVFRRAVVKLDQLDSASALDDLRLPPSNRLEALAGERKGQHSIRINQKWRLCFVWKDGNADDAEITDYH